MKTETLVAVASLVALAAVPAALADDTAGATAADLRGEVAVTTEAPAAETQGKGFHHQLAWNEGRDAAGRAVALAGSCFPVYLVTPLQDRRLEVGEQVQARLADDLVIGGKIVASRGALLTGNITRVLHPRCVLKAEFSPHRWLKAGALVGVEFNELLADSGDTVAIAAIPAPKSALLLADGRDAQLIVDKDGDITGTMSPALKGQAISLGITAACLPAGPFGLAIAPVANGLVGAVKPSYELRRAITPEEKHAHMKGFAMGLVNGLPGAFVVSGIVNHGEAVSVGSGYRMLVELKQDFSGADAESATRTAAGSEAARM